MGICSLGTLLPSFWFSDQTHSRMSYAKLRSQGLEKAETLPRWLLEATKHGVVPGPQRHLCSQGGHLGHGGILGAYLGQGLHHRVQQSSHARGHFQQFQH